jgi:predicted flap endonuclease-1-like 5' DNA nuclease
MWEIVMKMLLCLLIAAILGGIIGWLLRSLFCKKKCDELEANLSSKDKELADLRVSLGKSKSAATAENSKDDAEIATLKAKLTSLESELSAKSDLDAEWKNQYTLLQTDLDSWKNKHAKLEADVSAQAGANVNAESDLKAKYSTMEAELKSTKADLAVCHERQSSIESELKGWESKSTSVVIPAAATLASSTVSSSNDDEIARLKSQIAKLKVQVEETESEKVYLLGRVKKAESGESISSVVPMDQRDDLELVNGIGPVLERMLYDMGIYFFKDVASWDAAKIAEIDAKLPRFQGRIVREGWVESAKEEHFKKYGERL